MNSSLTVSQITPEEIELAKKRRVVERLADRLADAEEEIADLRTELERFEARYAMEVGRLYAEQDEIDAEIAEEELKLVPDDEEIKRKVEDLRRAAEESASRAKAAEEMAAGDWKPTAEARRVYHELARSIHPDLVLNADEKDRRHSLMARLNHAYSSGDGDELRRLADQLRVSPEAISGGTVGDELVRAIRQIAQMRRRIGEIRVEIDEISRSELYELHRKACEEAAAGRDMLAQMAERAKTHIGKTRRRLENLRNVNASAEEYVKERFGLDISEFR